MFTLARVAQLVRVLLYLGVLSAGRRWWEGTVLGCPLNVNNELTSLPTSWFGVRGKSDNYVSVSTFENTNLRFCCCCCSCVFRDRVSLFSPGCSGTRYVDQAGP